ncbi:MAG: hypothetical protein L0387_25525 [Acidobacteria bacterium]|nr:hypothetical protein [Acidobacteriota bacterium]MCI0722778.1 hypothetical protein [Acidobacteriota bacterium]
MTFSPSLRPEERNGKSAKHAKERYRVQFRWQMFNAFNRARFSNPRNNP